MKSSLKRLGDVKRRDIPVEPRVLQRTDSLKIRPHRYRKRCSLTSRMCSWPGPTDPCSKATTKLDNKRVVIASVAVIYNE